MKKLIFTFVCALLASVTWAQGNKTEEEAIKKAFFEYIDAYNKITETKSKDAVLKYVAADFTSTLINSSVSNTLSANNSDYKGFSEYLNRVANADKFAISYKVDPKVGVIKVYADNNVGYLIYNAAYEIKVDGGIWSKGTEAVTVTYRKENNVWKIFHLSVFTSEDEKQKGNCLCELFAGGAGSYVAKTTVPSGKSYTTNLVNVEIKPNGLDKNLVINDMVFLWSKTGDVFAPATSAGEQKSLGKASDDKEAIQVVLKNYLYVSNCLSLQLKK